MAILLFRLSGSMQSWGSRSRFGERDTESEPTKSGVLGLFCAAMGKPRAEDPKDGFPTLAVLSELRLGIRVDREGVLRRDFQTAGGGRWRGGDYGVRKASGAPGDTVISNRYYLADAVFFAALEGDQALLKRLDLSLAAPIWPLCLGRKAFVPDEPVRLADEQGNPLGLRAGNSLEEVLKAEPWLMLGRKQPGSLRFVLECGANEEGIARQDVPLSFVSAQRQHAVRRVREVLIPFQKACKQEAEKCS